MKGALIAVDNHEQFVKMSPVNSNNRITVIKRITTNPIEVQ